MKTISVAFGGFCAILAASAAAGETHVGFYAASSWLLGALAVRFVQRRDPPGNGDD